VRRFLDYVRQPVRTPAAVIALLALSALIGNAAQWQERGDLKSAAEANNAEAECRSRIIAYVDGLRIQHDVLLGTGLLDRVGVQDGPTFAAVVEAYERVVTTLETAAPYRENAVEVCKADPDFDVADITG
jgi:hypothetical protein